MKKVIGLILIISLLSFTSYVYSANRYGCTALTGGGAGALDALDIIAFGSPNTDNLADGDSAIVSVINGTTVKVYEYIFDADGTDAENSPNIIRPDDYVSGGVWRLVKVDNGMIPNLSSTYQSADSDLTSLSNGITGLVKGAGDGGGYIAATDGIDYWSPTSDGSGSGLDADTLDSYDSSYFESHTSNDFDPDRLLGDSTDNNLIDANIINTGTTSGDSVTLTIDDFLSGTASPGQVPEWNGTNWVPATISPGGDVNGPVSSTDNAIARFDGTTGKLLQDSSITIDDNGNLSANGSTEFTGSNTTSRLLIGQGIATNVTNFFNPTAVDGRHYNGVFQINPGSTSAGDKVALYAAAETGSTTLNDIWAGNFLAQKDSGSPSVNVQGVEIDINNKDADSVLYPSSAASWGLNLTSGGDYKPSAALRIGNTASVNKWKAGIDIENDSFDSVGISVNRPSSNITGSIVAKQLNDGTDTLVLQRAIDSSPAGYFLRLVNSDNSSDLFSVTAAGLVGIGTGSPTAALDIKHDLGSGGNILVLENLDADDDLNKVMNILFKGKDSISVSKEIAKITTIPLDSNWVDADLAFYIRGSDSLSEAMRIKNNGRVGIGTTNPASLLSVGSGGQTAPQITVDGSEASRTVFRLGGNAQAEIGFGQTGYGGTHPTCSYFMSNNGIALGAYAGDTYFFLDTTSGQIGIGNTNPGYLLDVSGDINIGTGQIYRVGGAQISTNNLSDGNSISPDKLAGDSTDNSLVDTAILQPAGSDTQIQFNDGGALGADSRLTWLKGDDIFSVTGRARVTSNLELGSNPTFTIDNAGTTVSTMNIRAKGATDSKSLIRMVPNGNPTGDKAELTWMGTDPDITDRWWVDMKTHEDSSTLRRFHILSDANGTEEPVTRFSIEIDGENESSVPEEFSIVRNGWIAQAEQGTAGDFMLRIVGGTGITRIENNRIDLDDGNAIFGTENGDVVFRSNGGNVRSFLDNTYELGVPSFRWKSLHIGTGDSTIEGKVGINNTAPTSFVDVSGTTGYDQLRLRTSYTPTSTSDTNGNVGDVTWDDNYIYIKTSAGWKRAALSTF